ncbi:DUF6838 family protein [Oscillibacter sp. GMB15532]|uniref:phage tail terminator family protein n=1 Tax=Oscillibacter sp. GMB15532 TaxID=3230022 RepID=UPI0034DFF3DC
MKNLWILSAPNPNMPLRGPTQTMITPDEITAAVSGALRELFPEEPVYENIAPQDFLRPCNLMELTGIALGEISPGGVELLYTYRITDFVEEGQYNNGPLPLLDLRTMLLLGLFAKGYLKAGDRALKVRSCTTVRKLDLTETTAILSLAYNRTDFDSAAVLPMMEQLTLQTNTKEDTSI